jgi:hypothetical protein
LSETDTQIYDILEKLETSELQSAANYFVGIYPNDLESSLGNELIELLYQNIYRNA